MSGDGTGFTPVGVGVAPYWPVVGPFVEAAVAEAVQAGGSARHRLLAAAVPFVVWCWQVRGMPLERERIFRGEVVEDFLARGMPGLAAGSRATHRSGLRRLVEVLGADGGGVRRKIPRSDPTFPYTPAEVALLYAWARGQKTARRRFDARILLILGLGAGLATREIQAVTTSDLETAGSQAWVRVRQGRARRAPVLPLWAAELSGLRTLMPEAGLLFRRGRSGPAEGQITDFVRRQPHPLEVRPDRMRTTWLVRHLESGTPPARLLEISGLATWAALDRLARFARPPGGPERLT